MNKKFHIKINDKVIVIAGNEKGKKGNVLLIDKKKKRAIVEGVNMVKIHKKPSAEEPQGGIHDKEASIHISNLMLLGKNSEPSRISIEINKKGEKNRILKKTGEII